MTKSEAKESVTLFGMANAKGEGPPPLVIYPRQRVPDKVIASVVSNELASTYNDTNFP